MRTILFRGKRIDNGEWVYGDLIHSKTAYQMWINTHNIECAKHTFIQPVEVIPESVGQYTGLTDNYNLQKVFEYDIIDTNGKKVGNYYENKNLLKNGVNILIEKMGTRKWVCSEQEAIKRGYQYAE